ncbi:MAG: pseudouridine synthase [Steroidobacteraceae bacterium]
METERLQKLLAAAGHGSRRQIEEWIRAGRVTVDGETAELGLRVAATADIRLDGRRLELQAPAGGRHQTLMYNKPQGEVTTRRDPQGRPTVFEHLPPPAQGRWVVVGRLDVNTTGLLLFTTDGELAHRLMHPSSQIEREYLVRVRGLPTAATLAQLRRGVPLDDGPARFLRLEAGQVTEGHSWFHAVLQEGRNREVRRLWNAVGHEVARLIRLRYGPISLPEGLRVGQSRLLNKEEVRLLSSAAGQTLAEGEQ